LTDRRLGFLTDKNTKKTLKKDNSLTPTFMSGTREKGEKT